VVICEVSGISGMRDAGRGTRVSATLRAASIPRESGVRVKSNIMAARLGHSHRDLRVWNTAISLVLEVYRISETFPSGERFGLTSQMRRSAVSIPSNIAEGHSRTTRGEYKNALSIARGSVAEVEVQLTLATELGYVQPEAITKALDQCDAISRMITKLKRAL